MNVTLCNMVMIEDGQGRVLVQHRLPKSPNPPIWNEGYPVWWHLSNVRLLDIPVPCRGNVGMWQLPEEIKKQLKLKGKL